MSKPIDDARRKDDQGKRATLACPHCRGALRIRTSRTVTTTYRQFVLACFNPECGFTCGAEMSITHAISPSARPDPAVRLRQAPPRRRPAPANDDQPARSISPAGPEVPAANDEVIASTG
ncbi:ogr/Delta-like zinc finger family protein [Sphingomonas bacterium]|uniref:ogr/Delta-like zinc finger family protein n=1 Tax=Sphingomonas bacterium TaxID=1895847 RepID=UPI0015758733|nr:ogr/Delta-like zinc finger family protein [Sphingomonas bacterium]